MFVCYQLVSCRQIASFCAPCKITTVASLWRADQSSRFISADDEPFLSWLFVLLFEINYVNSIAGSLARLFEFSFVFVLVSNYGLILVLD